MNWVQLQDNWDGLTAVVLSHWPKLTRDDLAEINGDRDRLAGTLRQRYGYSEEQAEHAICAFEKEVRYPGAVK